MTANEAIDYMKELLEDFEAAKAEISEYLSYYKDEVQEFERKLTALEMGIGALELCEKAKERS